MHQVKGACIHLSTQPRYYVEIPMWLNTLIHLGWFHSSTMLFWSYWSFCSSCENNHSPLPYQCIHWPFEWWFRNLEIMIAHGHNLAYLMNVIHRIPTPQLLLSTLLGHWLWTLLLCHRGRTITKWYKNEKKESINYIPQKCRSVIKLIIQSYNDIIFLHGKTLIIMVIV